MTDNDIDAIRQREQAATEGPWTTGADEAWSDVFPPWALVINANHPLIEMQSGAQGVADAEFIAHARTDVPALLAKVDELTAERDEYAADNTRVVAQLVAANHHADGLNADLRSANTANTAYANENARLRRQLGDVASVQCWTNEDGKRFVFAADLQAAMGVPVEAEATR